VLHRLAGLIKIPYAQLVRRITPCGPHIPKPCWNGSPYQPIPVTDQAAPQMAVQILEQSELYPDVFAETQALRNYPQPNSANAAHLLGYLRPVTLADLKKDHARDIQIHGSDLIGATGLEATYDSYLRGQSGLQVVSVDAAGGVTGTLSDNAPVAGDNVVTSLDARVQTVLEQSLGNAMKSARQHTDRTTGRHYAGDSAAGVVIDVRTGHIVAMASLPTYNPNIWVGGISQKALDQLGNVAAGQPILDRATDGEFAPGSTFKLITTAGVVHEGRASFNGIYNCPGSLKVGNSTKHNFEGEFGGHISLHQTIVMSCDTVYYQFAIDDWFHDQALIRAHKKPIEGVQNMSRDFGLGRPTGIDLPTDLSGLIEDRAQKLKDWNTYVRKNACAGAKRRPKGSYLQQIDQENCTDGWVFREGDQANFDIGQGTVLVTPLQLAVAYEALVNGGRVVSPRIGKAVLSPAGSLVRPITCPVVGKLPVSRGTLNDIMSAMYDVPRAAKGTARGAFAGFPFGQIKVGGKTGTADVAHKQPTSWFASFGGPAGQPPQYVVLAMVTQAGQGAAVAAPAVRAVWDGIYGLEHHSAALVGGVAPTKLPVIAPDGTVHPPGTKIAPPRRTSRPTTPGSPGATPAALPPEGRIRAGPYA
jgi:penicillin-binding protein 2